MKFISPTFYKNKMKHVYDNTVCPGTLLWCIFVNGNVFFSKHILNKAEIHTHSCTILLFKVSFGKFLFNVEMNCLLNKTNKTDKSHILSGKTHTFQMNYVSYTSDLPFNSCLF